MTKTELYLAFQEQISPTAITAKWPPNEPEVLPLEFAVVGKFCRVVDLNYGSLDVWLCNPRDQAKGLGTGKLRNIIRGIEQRCFGEEAIFDDSAPYAAINGRWQVLDGEAFCQHLSTEQILQSLDLLGIRRKRKVSEAQKQAGAERLANARTRKDA